MPEGGVASPAQSIGIVLHAADCNPATIAPLLISGNIVSDRLDFCLKTFIVEDSALILRNLIDTLEELSPVQVVGSAADEESAVAWLTSDANLCDLIIIDVFLKGGTGLGVLRAAQRLGLRGKRVVLTNYATQDMRAACRALGADRVFDKSSEIEELVDYCERLHGGESSAPGELN
jgi:DNA-binding NarL/FixJ family response regulator